MRALKHLALSFAFLLAFSAGIPAQELQTAKPADVGFSARTTLARAPFGINKWKKLVGAEVEVLIEVEATRARDGKEED